MKLIRRDNYNRDHINDLLIAENVHNDYGTFIKVILNDADKSDAFYFDIVPDDYQLQKWEP